MTLLDWEAWALVVVPILPLMASIVLVRHWGSASVSLHERTMLALRDTLIASIAAAISVNRLMNLGWDGQTVLVLLAFSLILVSLPSAYWLFLYFRGAFR